MATASMQGLPKLRAARAQFKSRLMHILRLSRRTVETGTPGMGVVDGLTRRLFSEAEAFLVPSSRAFLESVERLPASSTRGPAGRKVLVDFFDSRRRVEDQQKALKDASGGLQKLQNVDLESRATGREDRIDRQSVENVCANALQVWRGDGGREGFVALLDAVALGQMTGCDTGTHYLKAQAEMQRVLGGPGAARATGAEQATGARVPAPKAAGLPTE